MPIVRIGTETIVNTTTLNFPNQPSIVELADGRFVMTWDSGDTGDGSGFCVRYRLFGADGTPLSSDFIVNTTASGNQGYPSIAALADGGYVITWASEETGDGSGDCVRARIFNADGTALGSDFIVNTTADLDQQEPTVATQPDGRFLVTWSSDDTGDGSLHCVRGRIFEADGTAVGDDFIINSTAQSHQNSPAATALGNGRYIVTWRSGDSGDGDASCIRGRLLEADGTAVGDDFIVNSTTTGDQYSATVTTLTNGRFVVTWESADDGDGSFTCARARIFNADGTATGADFIVNSTSDFDQENPVVTALADGRFVATWQSFDLGDGAASCIRSRLFDSQGTVIGNDFIVNTTATGEQYAPSVAARADGRFVVTWVSNDTGDGSDGCLRSQTFDPTIFNGTIFGDTWSGGALADRIYGLAGNDVLSGFAGDDILSGDGGADTLYGGGGNDKLFGGSGDDLLVGGLGDDALFGGTGSDTLNGGVGADRLDGGGGYDFATYAQASAGVGADLSATTVGTGEAAGDTFNGIEGIVGSQHDDILGGDANSNVLKGGNGADQLVGRAGNDEMEGGNGADQLFGGAGGDSLYGGFGADRLDGGAYTDMLEGGGGSDSFVFQTALNAATNVDQIVDFTEGLDSIRLDNAIFTGLAAGALAATAFKVGAAATTAAQRIVYDDATGDLFFDADGSGGGAQIQFADVSAGLALTQADFLVF